MPRTRRTLFWTLLLCGGCLLATATLVLPMRGAEDSAKADSAKDKEDDLSAQLPRIPATDPEKALETFQLQHGFSLETVAHEPLVEDPVDVCYDENGRMFVAEMRDYPYSPEPRPQCPEGRGRPEAGLVRMLEDTDGDGRYEKSVIFADKLQWPTSVCCYNGGVFVVAAPHLYYFKDTDGDDKADVREIVLTGFGRGNVQGLVNNLKWGLNNRIHFASGMNGGELKHRDKPLTTIPSGTLVEFDPATETFQFSAGGSQFGHSFDDWGHRFVCNNSDHIMQVVFPQKYLLRNKYLPVPAVTRSISKEGGAAPVFRKSQAEPWRIVRTKRRASDPDFAKRLPPNELVPIGFFTSATGVTIYRGSAYPEEFRGNAFIGDVGGNLIHRKTLQPNGAALLAVRADEGVEFLTSTDNWFRPVNFVNAPDGTLLMLDMYRETIEHPFSIPEDIKKHLDLESGFNRGRLYRLVSPEMKRITPPKLGELSTAELVAQLESPNSWNRETAQRLLWQKQAQDAIPLLTTLATESKSPLGRLHALWTLEGLNGLTVELLEVAVNDSHAGVRAQAVRLCDPFLAKETPLTAKLIELAGREEEYDVRLQLAFSLGEITGPEGVEGLVSLVSRNAGDRDFQLAWLTSVSGKAGVLGGKLLKDADLRDKPGVLGLVQQLAGVAAADQQATDAAILLAAVAAGDDLPLAARQAVLKAFGEGLARRGTNITKLLQSDSVAVETRAAVQKLFDHAAQLAADENRPLPERATAISLLGYNELSAIQPIVMPFLTPQTPPPLQSAAALALAEHSEPEVGTLLIEGWSGYSPTVRKVVLDSLFQSAPRLEQLMAALADGKIRTAEVERDKKQLLLNHPNAAIKAQAQKLLGGEVAGERAKIITQYQEVLKLDGDAARGAEVFKKTCSTCHLADGVGKAVGPNLATTANKTPADLLLNVLDPNREALPAFTSYTLTTDQGKILTGIIASESATSLTLRRAEAAEDTVLRANIDELSSNGISFMPEGLEKDINLQQMADLIAFIRNIKPEAKK